MGIRGSLFRRMSEIRENASTAARPLAFLRGVFRYESACRLRLRTADSPQAGRAHLADWSLRRWKSWLLVLLRCVGKMGTCFQNDLCSLALLRYGLID